MKGIYGRASYGVQAAKGAVAAAWLPLGIIDRPRVNLRSGTEALLSVGDDEAVELSEGMAVTDIGVNITALQHPGFLNQAEKDAGGEVPWLSWNMGYHKGADDMEYEVIDCKLDSFTFRCESGGRPSVDVALIGGKVVKAAAEPEAMTWPGERSYRYFELEWDEAAELLAFELTVRNNLDALGVIAGNATVRDPDRIWDYLEEGHTEVSGTLTYLLGDESLDVHDCLLPSGNHTLTLTACSDISPEQSIAIAVTTLKKVDDQIELPTTGNIEVTVPFLAKGWSIT